MDLSRETLLKMYETMVTIRTFDEVAMYEMGQRLLSSSAHSSVGQEAVSTGICAAITKSDYLASTHRGHAHCIAKGVDPKQMMAELFGRTTGTNKGRGGSMHIADMSVGMLGANGVVAASVPLAVGAALTSSTNDTGQVAVSFFGDGGVQQGVLHESMNLASIWKLPVVFVCENNQYAESTSVEYALAVETVADFGPTYGMPGVVVDGQDVFAVYEAASQAVERARSGQGPSLLECKTYRYEGHSLGDNPLNYRLKEEEERWRARDPLILFRNRVLEEGALQEAELDEIVRRVEQLIQDAVKYGDESPLPAPEEVYDNVYVDYPVEELRRGTSMAV